MEELTVRFGGCSEEGITKGQWIDPADATRFRDETIRVSVVCDRILGIGGKLGQLFTTRPQREAFMATPEYAEIARIRDSMRWYWNEPKTAQKASERRRVQQ